jgi:thymidylate synthase ThyX
MTTIAARVVADSITKFGDRLTTFELTYPRFIHAEFMTHRMFSRNAASSRAIPFKKMLARVRADPALPLWWGLNEPGMQARAQAEPALVEKAKAIILAQMESDLAMAEQLAELGLHKQIVNRYIEPYNHITVVCSATDFDNFYALRDHEDAEPHIQILAAEMLTAHNASEPVLRAPGEWHLPYVKEDERHGVSSVELVKFSTARCARVSYLNHDQSVPDSAKDIELHDRLLKRAPVHASPAEHPALSALPDARSGNFRGWVQYRKSVANENVGEYPKFLKRRG